MKIAAIIQARMGSTRLPGKVLKDLNGKPLIAQIINRLKYSKRITDIVLATTKNSIDNPLIDWGKENGVEVFRGDENNVLKRYADCAVAIKADIIIRITADDPFKDPKVIDSVIDLLINDKLDFAFNNKPPSFPEGLDTEVFTIDAIKQANVEATSDFEKEHVTQYFYKNPHLFKMKNFSFDRNVSNLRLTVDTEEDFKLAETLYKALSPNGEMFYLDSVLKYFEEHPEIKEINKDVKRSAMYANNADTVRS